MLEVIPDNVLPVGLVELVIGLVKTFQNVVPDKQKDVRLDMEISSKQLLRELKRARDSLDLDL